jgi:hypothetical protein
MVLSADYCCCGLLSSVRWMRKSWLVLLPAVEECFAEETGQWTKMLDAWKVFGRREKDSTYSIRVHSMRRAGIPAIFELAAGERARESWAEIDTAC